MRVCVHVCVFARTCGRAPLSNSGFLQEMQCSMLPMQFINKIILRVAFDEGQVIAIREKWTPERRSLPSRPEGEQGLRTSRPTPSCAPRTQARESQEAYQLVLSLCFR